MNEKNRRYTIEHIKPFLSENDKIIGNIKGTYFTNVQAVKNVSHESLDWINPSKPNRQELFEISKAMIIICNSSISIDESKLANKCVIVVKNPKLIFARIANKIFKIQMDYGVHPTAFIHPEAKIHPNSYIGPFTYIGKSSIGENTMIYGHCYIYDKVKIGNNVVINSGTVIGSEGFGYVRNENKELEKFPHIAGVIIEDDVEIGSNTSIDRGSLSDTIISKGAKIDNLVHIAHNVIIGKHSAVIANAMIAGSVKIGDYSWIAPSASILEQLSTGENVVVGVGAVVTKNIPDNETWVGAPAKPINEFIELQKKFRKLSKCKLE